MVSGDVFKFVSFWCLSKQTADGYQQGGGQGEKNFLSDKHT
jgi:hypothetical protein